ncbi:unnamed protein product, partial [Rotaria sp. Silwood2]
MMNVTLSSSLTINSETFIRPYGRFTIYYYEAFEMTVPADGDYIIIMSNSSIVTCGLLYTENFYSNSPTVNLVTIKCGVGGNSQYQFSYYIKSDIRYILVITTRNAQITGNYTLLVSGFNRVNLRQINSSSIVSTTTTTS